MTAQQCTPPQAALVAIDIAKDRNEVLIDPGPGMRRRRLTVLNTRAEHDRLVATLAGLGMPVIFGFEPTGNYHRGLVHRLIAAGFEVRLISRMALARTREALHNGWDKNDPKDAQVILHMLRIGASTVYTTRCGRHQRSCRNCRRRTTVISQGQDRAAASHPDPLPAAVLSRGRRLQGTARSDWFFALLDAVSRRRPASPR